MQCRPAPNQLACRQGILLLTGQTRGRVDAGRSMQAAVCGPRWVCCSTRTTRDTHTFRCTSLPLPCPLTSCANRRSNRCVGADLHRHILHAPSGLLTLLSLPPYPTHLVLLAASAPRAQDCAGRYEGNLVADNREGSVAISALFDLDPDLLPRTNTLTGGLRRPQ